MQTLRFDTSDSLFAGVDQQQKFVKASAIRGVYIL